MSNQEAQQLKDYYRMKVQTEPDWRPLCTDCPDKPTVARFMLKLSYGFYCVCCKTERRFDMTKISRRAA